MDTYQLNESSVPGDSMGVINPHHASVDTDFSPSQDHNHGCRDLVTCQISAVSGEDHRREIKSDISSSSLVVLPSSHCNKCKCCDVALESDRGYSSEEDPCKTCTTCLNKIKQFKSGDSELKEGQIYTNVNDAKAAVLALSLKTYATFRIRTNSSKSLYFQCKHGFQRPSKSAGIRIRKTVVYHGCTARIRFYKNIKGHLKCTLIDNNHNHDLSEALYKPLNSKLSDDDKSMILSLHQLEAKPAIITKILNETRDKRIDRSQVKNFVAKLKTSKTMKTAPSLKSESDSNEPVKPHTPQKGYDMTEEEKLKIVTAQINPLAKLIASSKMPRFLKYLEEMQMVEARIRTNRNIFLDSRDESSQGSSHHGNSALESSSSEKCNTEISKITEIHEDDSYLDSTSECNNHDVFQSNMNDSSQVVNDNSYDHAEEMLVQISETPQQQSDSNDICIICCKLLNVCQCPTRKFTQQ